MNLLAGVGGTFDGIWATIERYDFVTVAEYPTADAAPKAHTKLLVMGLFLGRVLRGC